MDSKTVYSLITETKSLGHAIPIIVKHFGCTEILAKAAILEAINDDYAEQVKAAKGEAA
mgnify:CR=1 FL=1|tara:strand:- start:295 stop:471 length:177 start_codon:yes stop_codon:yes gene_type:complete